MARTLPKYFNYLLACDLISSAFTFAGPLLAPLLMVMGKLSPTEAAWVQAGAYLAVGVFQPAIGHRIDMGKFRSVLVIGGLTFSAGIFTLLYNEDSFAWLLLGVICLLTGISTIFTLYMRAAVGLVSDEDRAFASGRTYLVHNIGFSIASTLAYFFLEKHKNTLLYCDLVTTVGVVIAMYLLFRKDANFLKPKNAGTDFGKIPWKETFAHPRVLIGTTLQWISVFIHVSVTPLIYEKMGMASLKLTALMLVVNTCVVVLLTSRVSKVINRYNERRICLMASALYASQAAIPFFLSHGGVVAITVLWTMGEILSAILYNQVIYRVYPKERSGLASGVMIGTRALGLFLSPLVGLVVLPLPAWGFAAVILIVSFAGASVIFPALKTRPLESQN